MVTMAAAKSTPTAEINDIQRQMALVRHELHHDVRVAVKSAQSLTDWRSLVRTHPWVTLATAAAAGYLIVPKRRSETPAVVAAALPTPSRAAPMPVNPASASRESRSSLMGTILGLLAPVAIRAAQNYAAQYLEQWLAPQSSGGPAEMGLGPRPSGGDVSGTPAFRAPGSPRDLR
jgi:hypothetical protein